MARSRLVFSGSGGQGVITAAIILAEAAVIYEGGNATQSQSYGAAARGGSTRSDIIISDEQILYPKVVQSNVLVCLTQDSYNTYVPIIRPGGIVITDSKLVEVSRSIDARSFQLPMYETVMKEIGKPIVFNICMLGAVMALTNVVQPESVLSVLKKRIPKNFIPMNEEALNLGIELGRQALA